MRNLIRLSVCIFGLAAHCVGLSALLAQAPVPHSVQLSGGYLDPANNTFDALYTSCNGNAGVLSRTTRDSHDWGFVSSVQYVNANEAVITAPEYATGNIIVEDVRADTQSISFAVYDENGELIEGSPDLVPARVRIVMR